MATDITDTAHAVEAAAVMGLLPSRPQLLAPIIIKKIPSNCASNNNVGIVYHG